MVSYSCFTFVRNLRSVFHLRFYVENTRCFNSRVPSWICGLSSFQHLLGFVKRVLMYLSLLLIVTVANEPATLKRVSLSVSASQERKQRGTVFEKLVSSFPLDWCQSWLCFAGNCVRQHPRTVTIRVRTSMLSSLHQRPTQSWNSVFSRWSMPPSLLHLVTLFATQSCLLDVSVRQCFLVF